MFIVSAYACSMGKLLREEWDQRPVGPARVSLLTRCVRWVALLWGIGLVAILLVRFPSLPARV